MGEMMQSAGPPRSHGAGGRGRREGDGDFQQSVVNVGRPSPPGRVMADLPSLSMAGDRKAFGVLSLLPDGQCLGF